MEKNNAWNIRHLVNESFIPATQRIILKIVGFLALEDATNPKIQVRTVEIVEIE